MPEDSNQRIQLSNQSKSIKVIEFDYRSNRTQSNFYIFFAIDSIDLIDFLIGIRLALIDVQLTSIAIRCDFNSGKHTVHPE